MSLIVGPAPGNTGAMSVISMVELCDFVLNGNGPALSKNGTITGTAGFGSSLFLARVTVPARINLSEIDVAMAINFNATNDGAGTISRSMALYSFGNSTLLSTLCSASGTSSWNTGTVTAGASTSLTQFQGGWSATIVQPLTFASTSVLPGEYVVGQLFDFAQATSTWTVGLFGPQASKTQSDTTYNVLAASAFTGSTSTALTAWSAAPSAFIINKVGSTAALTTAANSSILATATAASTASLLLNAATAGFNVLSSAGLSAGSFVTGSATQQIAAPVTQTLRYVGTADVNSIYIGPFKVGRSSTGAFPSSIGLTALSVTSAYFAPWFALIGA